MSHEIYLWLKAAHIVAVMFWVAGLLYLPRLMVYHAAANAEDDANNAGGGGDKRAAMLQVMERRLLKVIMSPAMMVSWVLGLTLSGYDPASLGGWFVVKFLLVMALTGFHVFLSRQVKAFARGDNQYSELFYRRINELPAIVVIVVVVLVIVRPI